MTAPAAARLLTRADSVVGEGPVWDAAIGRLRWIDIMSGALNCTDPATGATTSAIVPTLVGAAAPRATGGLVLATRDGFAAFDGPDGPGYHPRLDFLPDGHRMNDAAVDPWGRYWAGSTTMTFAFGEGRLHMLDADWRTELVLDGFALPNGMGWSPDRHTFYLVDTMPGEILAYDVEPDTHRPVGKRLFARVDADRGLPDGMAVDAAGCLWVALWGGAAILQLAPDGSELGVLDMPVRQASSCAFGGSNLDRLFVTSARDGLDLPDDAPDGSLYVLDHPGARGQPPTPFAG